MDKFEDRNYDSGSTLKKLTLEVVYGKYDTDCPNVLALVDYLQTIPFSSADAKRGFSRMKMVKNDWRSRLGERNLTDLMLLNMESPSIKDFYPSDAIHKWYTSGQRSKRPYYMDDNCGEADPVLLLEDEEEEEVAVKEEEGANEEQVQQPSCSNSYDESDKAMEMALSLQDVRA